MLNVREEPVVYCRTRIKWHPLSAAILVALSFGLASTCQASIHVPQTEKDPFLVSNAGGMSTVSEGDGSEQKPLPANQRKDGSNRSLDQRLIGTIAERNTNSTSGTSSSSTGAAPGGMPCSLTMDLIVVGDGAGVMRRLSELAIFMPNKISSSCFRPPA